MKKTILVLLLVLLPLLVMAQSDDPEIMKAKEETAVVFDLGRFFGYLSTMEEEAPAELTLSKIQMKELYETLDRFLAMDRIEVDDADETLLHMEEELLTLDQLIYVDELAIEKMENRVSGTGSGGGGGAGGGSGGGQLANYVAGGAFNPLTDPAKPIGKDVEAFFDYLKKKLGK